MWLLKLESVKTENTEIQCLCYTSHSSYTRKWHVWEFPGGLVVRIWWCGPGSIPALGTEIPHQAAACCGQRKEKKRKEKERKKKKLHVALEQMEHSHPHRKLCWTAPLRASPVTFSLWLRHLSCHKIRLYSSLLNDSSIPLCPSSITFKNHFSKAQNSNHFQFVTVI